MRRRLVYVAVANARLPSEFAYGNAMMKMCEGYANAGRDVEFWYPYRKQDPRIDARSLFDYYGVAPDFRVRILPNIDVIPMEVWSPRSVFRCVLAVHDFAWAASVAVRAASSRSVQMCHTRDPAVAWWTTAARIPTILEVHQPAVGPRRSLVHQIARRPHLLGVIALTGATRDVLVGQGVDPAQILVRGSGVDLSGFVDLPSSAASRAAHALPKDRVVVGYVGRFRTLGAEKGLLTAVRAVGSMRRARGDAPLLLCVGGPMDDVDEYIRVGVASGGRPDDFRFVDHVPSVEVPGWIRACDLGVIPFPDEDHFSRYASPMKLFEFMACGVPVVASDLPALRETVAHDRDVWLVAPDSADDLARGLARLVDDVALRKRLAASARAQVDHHSWNRRAEAILDRFG